MGQDRDGLPVALEPVIQHAISRRLPRLRPRAVGPHGGGVDAQGVPGHVEGDASRLRRLYGDQRRAVPPCRHFAVVGGTLGVGVEVDLGALAGRPVRQGEVCELG